MFLSFIKKLLPVRVKRSLKNFYYYNILLIKVKQNQKQALKQIRKKEKIRVAFFLIEAAVWKLDNVFKLMIEDEKFDPILVICPYTVYGHEVMIETMDRAEKFIKEKGYNYIRTFNSDNDSWLDVKKELKPDIVFFTNPHNLTRKEYLILNYLDILTCYVPYGFMLANIQQLQFNQLFHNLLWKSFYETTIHKSMAEKYAVNKGRNVIVTGYPMCDVFIAKNYNTTDVWKIKDRSVKRIIWAPHHTIEIDDKELAYSSFLHDFHFVYELLDRFAGRIQIAFKPHPILKSKLYKHSLWGKEKTDEYYELWSSHENGQLEEGDYVDLFLTSDAMILDSISFIAEYYYTGKPSLFTVRDITIINKFNEFGKLAYDQLYKANDHEEILSFIENVVIKGNDTKYLVRNNFVKKYLLPTGSRTASENIIFSLRKEIAL